ncbi:MAG: macro domain-containing protein [Oscillospiraceae bacterium]|nr:macro domain-containing protein [Oscillospiraceae bacterium]
MKRFVVKIGDITKCTADALVHPVSEQLESAGVVSEEIFRAAADSLKEELKACGSCQPGSVVVTESHGLSVQKILHTVNPKWQGGDHNEEKILADCYRNCLNQAVELGCKTIAFPSISTGAYHFPVNLAANVAVKTILDFLKENQTLEEVSLICLDQRTTLVYDMCAAQYAR